VFVVNLKVDVNGEGMFYFLEYGLKFKTPNGTIYKFKAENNLHYIFKNAIILASNMAQHFSKRNIFKNI
jgi:hypothetical protein